MKSWRVMAPVIGARWQKKLSYKLRVGSFESWLQPTCDNFSAETYARMAVFC